MHVEAAGEQAAIVLQARADRLAAQVVHEEVHVRARRVRRQREQVRPDFEDVLARAAHDGDRERR